MSAYSQEFIQVPQVCPQCCGYGAVATPYGPAYCPTCGGHGKVLVTVRNPNYQYQQNGYNVSFGSNYNSDGYIYKGEIYLTRVVSGKKEKFYLFNKGGVDYIGNNTKRPFARLTNPMTISGIKYRL